MREIKFRAKIKKRKDRKRFNNYNGWITGYYFKDDSTMIKFCKKGIKMKDDTKHYIINTPYEDEFAEIIPETLGQYTGLKDKNGVEIYENDIVVNHLYGKEYKSIIKYGVFNVKCCGCCYQYHKVCGFYLADLNSNEEFDIELDENTLDNLEVIGNIYDNKGDVK